MWILYVRVRKSGEPIARANTSDSVPSKKKVEHASGGRGQLIKGPNPKLSLEADAAQNVEAK